MSIFSASLDICASSHRGRTQPALLISISVDDVSMTSVVLLADAADAALIFLVAVASTTLPDFPEFNFIVYHSQCRRNDFNIAGANII